MLCQAELSRAIGLSGLMEMCQKKEYAVDKAAVSRAMDAEEPTAAVAALLQPALRDSLEALQEAKAARAYSCPPPRLLLRSFSSWPEQRLGRAFCCCGIKDPLDFFKDLSVACFRRNAVMRKEQTRGFRC